MIELWKALVIAALGVACVEMLELNTAQQSRNAYQQGEIDRMERQLEFEQGKNYRQAF